MSFCPNCKLEYVAGISRCNDCGVLLVEQLSPQIAQVFSECEHCFEEILEGSDFCFHCGTILSDEEYFCEEHSDTPAIAVCIICHRLLCAQCTHDKQGRYTCDDHNAVEVSEDWAVAFQSVDFFEANIVQGKLENAGITVSPRNNSSVAVASYGFIEGAIGRSILKYPVKIFVPLDQFVDAEEIIKEESPPEE